MRSTRARSERLQTLRRTDWTTSTSLRSISNLHLCIPRSYRSRYHAGGPIHPRGTEAPDPAPQVRQRNASGRAFLRRAHPKKDLKWQRIVRMAFLCDPADADAPQLILLPHTDNKRLNVSREQRTASPIIGLKSFNNWVKTVLINKFARYKPDNGVEENSNGSGRHQRNRLKVLDLGCGKGGDLQKWQKAGLLEYVGVGELDTLRIEPRRPQDVLKSPFLGFGRHCGDFSRPSERTLEGPARTALRCGFLHSRLFLCMWTSTFHYCGSRPLPALYLTCFFYTFRTHCLRHFRTRLSPTPYSTR